MKGKCHQMILIYRVKDFLDKLNPLFGNKSFHQLNFQIQLCALRAQTEFGDYGYANNFDYK